MSRNPYYQGPASDYFDGLRFFNPDHPSTDRGLRDLLRWRFGPAPSPWTQLPPAASVQPEARRDALTITLIGHASLLLQVDGHNLLVDPVWSERASPLRGFGPRRWNPPAVALQALPPIDAVLITHNHYDHLDLDTLRTLQARFQSQFVAPLGNDRIITRAIPAARVATLDWWQSLPLAASLQLSVVPANHWSARGLRDRRMALWGGFHLRGAGGSCYLAGDTGYGDGTLFTRIGERFADIDVAVLPIGAYEPRWFMHAQHMDAAEAVRAFLGCGARQALGMHWGTFRLTDEAAMAPPALLAETLQAHAIPAERFPAMTPGQVWTLDAPA